MTAIKLRTPIRILTATFLTIFVAAWASAQEGFLVDPDEAAAAVQAAAPEPAAGGGDAAPSGIDLLSLIRRGGGFMIPIGLMSLLVVALAIERFGSLRRGRILPKGLVAATAPPARPATIRSAADEHPSPAGRIAAAMTSRTGHPLGDVERAAAEAAQRELDRGVAPIRWLSLAAAATPLMGLLGTVWGMIVAFHESTTLAAGRSRSEQLGEGIYTALVTTLAGLAVAIPAAILALYLENRLMRIFRDVEQWAFDIAPSIAAGSGDAEHAEPSSDAAADAAPRAKPLPGVAAASPATATRSTPAT